MLRPVNPMGGSKFILLNRIRTSARKRNPAFALLRKDSTTGQNPGWQIQFTRSCSVGFG
ncbi:hypothetical protein [Leptospira adleri]|uniref:hypothetical protein n=1 Tax=Leptospira adleri TaxID=2023186 RepID=UPI00143867D9|nr:hypothetical protein [Leptospira adleri]